VETSNESKSLFPITDSGRPATKEAHQGFSERTRPPANCTALGIECFADGTDERTGDTGFDTTFWRTGMASTALPTRDQC